MAAPDEPRQPPTGDPVIPEAADPPSRVDDRPAIASDESATAGAAGPQPKVATTEPPPSGDRRKASFLREVPVLVLIALALAILIKTFVVQAFYIPSESMTPTLQVGDRVLVNKVVYKVGDIHRGDVIVFQNPDQTQLPHRNWLGAALHWLGEGLGLQQPENEDLIKRVIGLPGDTVEARNGRVYVNGRPLSEPYLPPGTTTVMSRTYRVPPGDLFVLGDNRGNSADSRVFGFLPERDVIGKAFVIIWPPSDIGRLGG